MAEHIPSVVIWGDGAGSTFRATVDAVASGIVNFDIVGVVTTNPSAGILDHRRIANKDYGMDIEPFVVNGKPGRRQGQASQEAVLRFMERREASSLALMGSLVIMGSTLVEELNGEVPEDPLPRDLSGALNLMIPARDGNGRSLPSYFPRLTPATGKFGLTNTHPAPTIVTANTHGNGAQRRMVMLRSNESAQTFHVVGKGIDTGPIIAAHTFPIDVLHEGASEEDIERAAQLVHERAQRIEKAHLPLDLEMQLNRRQQYLSSLANSH